MNHLNYVTRGGSNPQGKPKVFFSAHPGDTDCLGEVEKLILDRQDCVFFWLESDPGKEEEREHLFNLSLMQLLVVPVLFPVAQENICVECFPDLFLHPVSDEHGIQEA